MFSIFVLTIKGCCYLGGGLPSLFLLFLCIISTAYHLLSGSRAARLMSDWLIDLISPLMPGRVVKNQNHHHQYTSSRFFRDQIPPRCPTNSVKALKAVPYKYVNIYYSYRWYQWLLTAITVTHCYTADSSCNTNIITRKLRWIVLPLCIMWFVTNKALGKPLLNFSYLPVLNEQDDSSIEFIFTIIIMGEQEDIVMIYWRWMSQKQLPQNWNWLL